jgi:hypothetical protein
VKNKKLEFIPFHAINEFMRNDFRLQIIRSVLVSLSKIDGKIVSRINHLTKKHVKVAGFRNSSKAPATVKTVAMVKAFEKHPDLVSTILQAWMMIHIELRDHVYNLMLSRGWKLLPIDVDRSKLPGFLTSWPEGEDYEVLYNSLKEKYPNTDQSIDEASLMAVLLSGRLPINKVSFNELEELDGLLITQEKN